MAETLYGTVADLGGRIGVDDQSENGRLNDALLAASRYIDRWCGRRFFQDDSTSTATFSAVDGCTLELVDDERAWDVSTLTGLVVAIDTGDDGSYENTLTRGTHYQAEPVNGLADTVEPWPVTRLRVLRPGGQWFPPGYGRPTVSVTARWGWPAVPNPVRQACLALAADIWKSKDVMFGGGGDSFLGEFSATRNLLAEALLAPYRHGLSMVGFA